MLLAPPPNCFQGSRWRDLYQKYMLFHWEARIPTKQGSLAATHLSEAKKLWRKWRKIVLMSLVRAYVNVKYMHKHISSVYAYNIVQQYLIIYIYNMYIIYFNIYIYTYIYIHIYIGDRKSMHMHASCLHILCLKPSLINVLYKVQYPVAPQWVRACHARYLNLGLHSCILQYNNCVHHYTSLYIYWLLYMYTHGAYKHLRTIPLYIELQAVAQWSSPSCTYLAWLACDKLTTDGCPNAMYAICIHICI